MALWKAFPSHPNPSHWHCDWWATGLTRASGLASNADGIARKICSSSQISLSLPWKFIHQEGPEDVWGWNAEIQCLFPSFSLVGLFSLWHYCISSPSGCVLSAISRAPISKMLSGWCRIPAQRQEQSMAAPQRCYLLLLNPQIPNYISQGKYQAYGKLSICKQYSAKDPETVFSELVAKLSRNTFWNQTIIKTRIVWLAHKTE